MTYNRTLFQFRQDLRINDNRGLLQAVTTSKEILPVFIFDTDILQTFPAEDTRMPFLIQAIQKLQADLQTHGADLYIYIGSSRQLIPELMGLYQCDSYMCNRSYGHNSLSRDRSITQRCHQNNKTYTSHPDYLLLEPDAVPTRKVFTPFYKLWMEIPKKLITKSLPSFRIPSRIPHHDEIISLTDIFHTLAPQLLIKSDTSCARSVDMCQTYLDQLDTTTYEETRNIPSLRGTSRLSPYLRFGICSVREVCRRALRQATHRNVEGIVYDADTQTVSMDRKLFKDSYISELAWREFWQHIAWHFPYARAEAFQEKRRHISRRNHEDRYTARQEGRTGYPIVDAGMRQLRAQNWMHGRVRMIVASFLTKDLLVDRTWGEQHFANYLLDYDANVNIGNRQRSASVGADPKPLRIFNPILQSKRFDPTAAYILRRIPELAGQEIRAIHDPLKYTLNYIPPIVDHYEMSRLAKRVRKGERIQPLLS